MAVVPDCVGSTRMAEVGSVELSVLIRLLLSPFCNVPHILACRGRKQNKRIKKWTKLKGLPSPLCSAASKEEEEEEEEEEEDEDEGGRECH